MIYSQLAETQAQLSQAKIHAQVLHSGDITRITEFEGEGDLRIATNSYYLTGDLSLALMLHARFSQGEGPETQEIGSAHTPRRIRIHPPFVFA